MIFFAGCQPQLYLDRQNFSVINFCQFSPQSLFKPSAIRWVVTVMPLQVSEAMPLCLLLEVYFNVLVSVDASLLVRYPELRGVR